MSDKIQCCNDCYSLAPEMICLSEFIQDASILVKKICSKNLVSRGVHQIPVIDVLQIIQIKIYNGFFFLLPFLPFQIYRPLL